MKTSLLSKWVLFILCYGLSLSAFSKAYSQDPDTDKLLIAGSNGVFYWSVGSSKVERWIQKQEFNIINKLVYLPGLFQIIVVDSNSVFYGLDRYFNRQVQDNYGAGNMINSIYQEGHVAYIASALGLYKAIKRYDGRTETTLPLPLDHVVALSGDQRFLYAVSADGKISKSSDQGSSWKASVYIGGTQANITAYAFSSDQNSHLVVFGTGKVANVGYYSDDAGDHWSDFTLPAGMEPNTVTALPNSLGFMAANAEAVWLSADGKTWREAYSYPGGKMGNVFCSEVGHNCYLSSGNQLVVYAYDSQKFSRITLPAEIGQVQSFSLASNADKNMKASIKVTFDSAFTQNRFGTCSSQESDCRLDQLDSEIYLDPDGALCIWAATSPNPKAPHEIKVWELGVQSPGIYYLHPHDDLNDPFSGQDLTGFTRMVDGKSSYISYPNLTHPYIWGDPDHHDQSANLKCSNPPSVWMDFLNADASGEFSVFFSTPVTDFRYSGTGWYESKNVVHSGDFILAGTFDAVTCYVVDSPLNQNTSVRFYPFSGFQTQGLTDLHNPDACVWPW